MFEVKIKLNYIFEAGFGVKKAKIYDFQIPLIRSQTRWTNLFYKYLKWRRPPMEDDLKALKVKYLNNHLLAYTQMLNLSLDDQTLFPKSSKWRRPPMDENL